MRDPLKASFGGGSWRKDDAGLMAPVGGSAGEKELIRLPKELEQLATSANTLLRGRFSRELWPRLSLLSTIGGKHQGTQIFIANISAGSLAENGLARTEYLEGLARMLVPSAMPSPYGLSRDGDGHKKKKQPYMKTEEDE